MCGGASHAGLSPCRGWGKSVTWVETNFYWLCWSPHVSTSTWWPFGAGIKCGINDAWSESEISIKKPCPYWQQAWFSTVIWECFLEPWSSVPLSNEALKWWCKSRISAWFLTPAVQLFKCKSRTISGSEPKNYPLGNALDSSICPLILCAVSAHWGTRGITGAVSSCNNASRIIWSNGQANNTWW